MEVPNRRMRKRETVAIWMAISVASLPLGFGEDLAASETVPTFTRDVAPISLKNCVKCHSPREIASRRPLTSYDAAEPLAEKIKQKVMAREMPPWPADPTRGVKFRVVSAHGTSRTEGCGEGGGHPGSEGNAH